MIRIYIKMGPFWFWQGVLMLIADMWGKMHVHVLWLKCDVQMACKYLKSFTVLIYNTLWFSNSSVRSSVIIPLPLKWMMDNTYQKCSSNKLPW